MPISGGTVTGFFSGPLLITMPTSWPFSTLVPAIGVVEMMKPSVMFSSYSRCWSGTRRPMFWRVASASRESLLYRSGIYSSSFPPLMFTVMVLLPSFTFSPGAGFCSQICSFSYSSLNTVAPSTKVKPSSSAGSFRSSSRV